MGCPRNREKAASHPSTGLFALVTAPSTCCSMSTPPCFGGRCGLLFKVVKAVADRTARPSLDDVRRETLAVWEQNRLLGWFLRDDFSPQTEDQLRRCLNVLARHGDRATYVQARLLKCL